jgi:hypothetical protein
MLVDCKSPGSEESPHATTAGYERRLRTQFSINGAMRPRGTAKLTLGKLHAAAANQRKRRTYSSCIIADSLLSDGEL